MQYHISDKIIQGSTWDQAAAEGWDDEWETHNTFCHIAEWDFAHGMINKITDNDTRETK